MSEAHHGFWFAQELSSYDSPQSLDSTFIAVLTSQALMHLSKGSAGRRFTGPYSLTVGTLRSEPRPYIFTSEASHRNRIASFPASISRLVMRTALPHLFRDVGLEPTNIIH